MSSYLTLAETFRYQPDPIKGSRFIATLEPVADTDDAKAFVQRLRDEMPDATHHCWAFRLRDGTTRSSDDGEPGGSAGRPMLAQLVGHEVFDVAAVVTRFYGGTKLGVGGLIRAYGGTAGKALDRAPLVSVLQTTRLTVEHSYNDTNLVDAVLAAEGLQVEHADYGSTVVRHLRVPTDTLARVRERLVDGTRGRATLSDEDGG